MAEPSLNSGNANGATPTDVDIRANSSERHVLSVPEIGERVAAEIGIDEKRAIRAVQMVQEYSNEYSGPIPPTVEIERLNQVEVGLGTNIVRDHLDQRAHERSMDLQMVTLATANSDRKDRWLAYAHRGQTFGMVSQVIFVGAALGSMYYHQAVLAGMFIAGPALGVVVQFIKGISEKPETKRKHSSEKEEKNTRSEEA